MAYGAKIEVIGLEDLMEIPRIFSERTDRALERTMQDTAQNLRDSLEQAIGRWKGGDVGWTGYLYNSIEAYNEGKQYSDSPDEWGVRMMDYGLDLDGRPEHEETLSRGKKITTWAKAHDIGITVWDGSKRVPKKIRVRPHPFIERGKEQLSNNLQSALNQYIGD